MDKPQNEKDFLSSPRIIENYGFLHEIGVFRYINALNRDIRDYKNLIAGAADIFNRTSIDEIMDAAVWQISDRFLPSFIIFLWKPLQNKDDITLKGYRNYKVIETPLGFDSINAFEPFFQKHRKPVNYAALMAELNNESSATALSALLPELVVPILGPSGLYGLILVGSKMLGDAYAAQELDYIQQLMSFVSQAIQNHLHYEHSVRDVKTGLYNHGFFITRLTEEMARAKRADCASSLVAIDVDKFKNFNDRYGHIAGDRVLEHIALRIKQNVRTEDVPSRFGGEEFTILLPNADRNTAWSVAERLRVAIAEMRVPWSIPLPQVTISLGIATFDKNTGISAEELLNRADAALYRSKEAGRNRTSMWRSGLLFRVEYSHKAPLVI
jgi:diguanylate cyclase (GGDEF)-like protein